MDELKEYERSPGLETDWSAWYTPPPPPAGGGWPIFRGTFLRSMVAAAIFTLLLFVRQTTWAPAAAVRTQLKYALTTEWNYRPVLAGVVDYGLKLASDIPAIKEMMASGPSQPATSAPATSPPASSQPATSADWMPPLKGRVIRPFGWVVSPMDGLERFSPGVDVAAPAGTEVKAALAGKVAKTGTDTRYGRYVLLDHGDGAYTLYGCLTGVKVFAGELVVTGQVLGQVAPASTRGVHPGQAYLHFELRESNKLVDPMSRVDLSAAK